MHQQHVLSLMPTGLPLSSALGQMASGGYQGRKVGHAALAAAAAAAAADCNARQGRPPTNQAVDCKAPPIPADPHSARLPTAAGLGRVEEFYDSIGGLAGYQLQCLELIAAHQLEGETSAQLQTGGSISSSSSSSSGSLSSMSDDGAPSSSASTSASARVSSTEFLVPVGLDLASPELRSEAAAAVAAGIAALPALAEVYPLGGAGDRLGLRCETSGESLPTAVLQYCGRSLLENLLRDLQVRFLCGAAAAPVCLSSWLPQLALKALSSLFNHTRIQCPTSRLLLPTCRPVSICTGSCRGCSTPPPSPS